MDGGHFNTSYDVQTTNPEHHIVLRIAPDDNENLLQYERTMILSEPFIYDLLKRHGIPTSRVLRVDGSKSVIGRNYIIIEYIDAVPMNHPSVPESVRPNLLRKVGEYTATMHNIRGERFGWPMPDGTIVGSEYWAEFFGQILNETCGKALEAEVISKKDRDVALGSYQNNLAVFDECRSPVLIHNDIWDPNILVNELDGEWRIAAIIDADRAVFADREYEFVLWDTPDQDLISGYNIPLNNSEGAILRRKYYRLQLYMLYAWFYLTMTANSDFRSYSKTIVVDILRDLRDNHL